MRVAIVTSLALILARLRLTSASSATATREPFFLNLRSMRSNGWAAATEARCQGN
jgi:hypothetical protein